MTKNSDMKYPRNRLMRGIIRTLGRIVLPIFFRIEIIGEENFPEQGPLLVVGNHTAAMEGVLIVVYTPWQIEMLGAGDIPQEAITEFFEWLYKYIPIRRGHVDRAALRNALGVLRQKGFLGIFPEGGVWDPGQMRAQSGVAWLSYRGKAPVLPIGFSGTEGALVAGLKLKRPTLTIHVGEIIPRAKVPEGKAKKTFFQEYANYVMDNVRSLLPEDDPSLQIKIKHESFELQVEAEDEKGNPHTIPEKLRIQDGKALAKLFHRPMIQKIYRFNLELPVESLELLHTQPSPSELMKASQAILESLNGEEYPYLLTYRFGPKEAEAMERSLEQLHSLANWAEENDLSLKITPIRRYYDVEKGEKVVQTRQNVVESWM